jgi:hypothetical protein
MRVCNHVVLVLVPSEQVVRPSEQVVRPSEQVVRPSDHMHAHECANMLLEF